MAIYENKFEIGDEVFTKDNKHEYPCYTLMADLLFATNFCESLQQVKCKVISYGLHPRNRDFIYLVEDENQHQHLFGEAGLEIYNGQDKEQTQKRQYKARAKWVMNTGEKPDLPDGTLVKVKLQDGVKANGSVGDWYWGLDILDTDCAITKWKLADDWNDVVDGQTPDIDGDTLIEVVGKDEHGRFTTTTTDDLFWDSVKKWRYAKEKKAK